MSAQDDLVLVVGDREIYGWTDISVTCGIERCPNSFSIGMTELNPSDADAVTVQPGDACQIRLGGDLVLTGYVNRFSPSIAAGAHAVHVQGRGKCQDVVDCAAEWPGCQFTSSSVLEIASKLAAAYGVKVRALTTVGAVIPQLNFAYGETAWEVIERACRYNSLLAYELPDGSLALSATGTNRAASGFAQGVNVQQASADWSDDKRFSHYDAYLVAVNTFGDVGDGGFQEYTTADAGVKRNRRMAIVAEHSDDSNQLAKKRAEWEKARRFGRASQVRIVTDSWRDASGALYTPNTLAHIELPALKVTNKDWLIGEVTYRRDEKGTACELLLMPPEAFMPEPTLLYPTWGDIPGAAR